MDINVFILKKPELWQNVGILYKFLLSFFLFPLPSILSYVWGQRTEDVSAKCRHLLPTGTYDIRSFIQLSSIH